MRAWLAYYVALAVPVAALGADLPPSGVQADLHEALYEPLGVPAASAKTLRLRYLAPEIADQTAVGFDLIEADFAWFCMADGLRLRAESAPMIEQIIVSIASEPIRFGETAPNVVQYFDAFRVENETCIWEGL